MLNSMERNVICYSSSFVGGLQWSELPRFGSFEKCRQRLGSHSVAKTQPHLTSTWQPWQPSLQQYLPNFNAQTAPVALRLRTPAAPAAGQPVTQNSRPSAAANRAPYEAQMKPRRILRNNTKNDAHVQLVRKG